jgi:hypothetical protein
MVVISIETGAGTGIEMVVISIETGAGTGTGTEMVANIARMEAQMKRKAAKGGRRMASARGTETGSMTATNMKGERRGTGNVMMATTKEAGRSGSAAEASIATDDFTCKNGHEKRC